MMAMYICCVHPGMVLPPGETAGGCFRQVASRQVDRPGCL